MAVYTFSWVPTFGARKTVRPVVRVIRFGDGYEQRQAPGMLRKPRAYALTFRADVPTAGLIDAFLGDRAGLEAFNYTHPGDTAGVFVCREWSRTRVDAGVDEVVCTFEEVFE